MNTPTQEKTLFQKFFWIFSSKKITEETWSKKGEITEILDQTPESSIDKKHKQELLIDERVAQEHPLFTPEISAIIYRS